MGKAESRQHKLSKHLPDLTFPALHGKSPFKARIIFNFAKSLVFRVSKNRASDVGKAVFRQFERHGFFVPHP